MSSDSKFNNKSSSAACFLCLSETTTTTATLNNFNNECDKTHQIFIKLITPALTQSPFDLNLFTTDSLDSSSSSRVKSVIDYCTKCSLQLQQCQKMLQQLEKLNQHLEVSRKEIIGQMLLNYDDDVGLLEGRQQRKADADADDNERVSLLVLAQRKNIMKEIISNLKETYKQHQDENLTQSLSLISSTEVKLEIGDNQDWESDQDPRLEQQQQQQQHDNNDNDNDSYITTINVKKERGRQSEFNNKQRKYNHKCTYCSKLFSRPLTLEAHTNSVHLKIKPYPCSSCSRGFANAEYLQKHQRGVHSVENPTNRRSSRAREGLLKSQIQPSAAEESSVVKIESQEEKQPFAAQLIIANIVETENKGSSTDFQQKQRRHTCPSCGQDFRRNINLRSHELKVHGQSSQVWNCTYPNCAQSFISPIFLRHHEKTHAAQGDEVKAASKRRGQKCPHCDKMICSKNYLQIHINNHLNLKPFSCQVCGRSFSSQKYLRNHATTHPELDNQQQTKAEALACPDCDKKFLHQQHLRIHRAAVHEESLDPATVVNNSKFKKKIMDRLRRRRRKNEVMIHGGGKMSRLKLSLLQQGFCFCCNHSQCGESGFKAQTEAQLLLHVQKTHFLIPEPNEVEFKFICLQCGADYAKVLDLRKHELSLHGSITRSWSCNWENCGQEQFPTQLRLRQHIQDVHFASNDPIDSSSSPKPCVRLKPKRSRPLHKCPSCPSAIFSSGAALRLHMNTHPHAHANLRPYICEICSFATTRLQYLRDHQTKHQQLNIQTNKCPDCHKTFSCPNYLRVHRMTQHAKEHKVTCQYCDYGTYYEATLQQHVAAVHFGEKKFICESCGLKFANSSRLKIHTRNHTGERPYICSTCGKGFMDARTLKRHSEIHDGQMGVNKYACSNCDKKFPVKNYLHIHMKSHAKNEMKN